MHLRLSITLQASFSLWIPNRGTWCSKEGGGVCRDDTHVDDVASFHQCLDLRQNRQQAAQAAPLRWHTCGLHLPLCPHPTVTYSGSEMRLASHSSATVPVMSTHPRIMTAFPLPPVESGRFRVEAARREGGAFRASLNWIVGQSVATSRERTLKKRKGGKRKTHTHTDKHRRSITNKGGAFLNILHMTKERLFLCTQVEQVEDSNVYNGFTIWCGTVPLFKKRRILERWIRLTWEQKAKNLKD